MKVYLDTNVFLDYIQQRPQGWKEAETIFFLAMNGDISLMISCMSFSLIFEKMGHSSMLKSVIPALL